MYRMVFRVTLMLALISHDEISASQDSWQSPQGYFLFPGGQYEEFYCNCWIYTPQCANVCKNYHAQYGNAVDDRHRSTQVKALSFNPNTMHYPGAGAVLNNGTTNTVRKGGVHSEHFPARHLEIETIISNERLGKKRPSAQSPRSFAEKNSPPAGVHAEMVSNQTSNMLHGKLHRPTGKKIADPTTESSGKICDFLIWIKLTEANSTDRKQKVLLNGVLNHFFKSNNLTEIVCKMNGENFAQGKRGTHSSLYTLKRNPDMYIFSQSTSMFAAPNALTDTSAHVLAGHASTSRVLYTKKYYTTTVTPMTTILTSLHGRNSEKNIEEQETTAKEKCASTMCKADVKQDALVIAGKVQEKRNKIEGMLNSGCIRSKTKESTRPSGSLRPVCRTTFVWKTATPYITKEVLEYPKTAYYTTTELFTITPLTTIFVDEVDNDQDYRGNESSTSQNFKGSWDTMLAGSSIAAESVLQNPHEGQTPVSQEELVHVAEYRDIRTNPSNEEELLRGAAVEHPKRETSADAINESDKGDNKQGFYPAEHRGISPLVVPALELQKQSSKGKDPSVPLSVTIKNVVELAGSLKSILTSLNLDSSLVQNMSTIGSAQSSTQPKSVGTESAADSGGLRGTTTGTSPATLVITTTVILELERILENQVKNIIRREKIANKGVTQNKSHLYDDTAGANRVSRTDYSDLVDEKKKGDASKESVCSKKQVATSVGLTTSGAGGKNLHLGVEMPAGTTELTKFSESEAVFTSVSPVLDGTSFDASGTISTVTGAGDCNADGKNAVDLNSLESAVRKKIVSEMSAIVGLEKIHGSSTKVTTLHLEINNRKEEDAHACTSKYTSSFTQRHTPQQSGSTSRRTHFAITSSPLTTSYGLDALHLPNTADTETVTAKCCAEDIPGSMSDKRLAGEEFHKQILERHVQSVRGRSLAAKDAQALSSATGGHGTSASVAIEDVVAASARSSVFAQHAVKSIVAKDINGFDASRKREVHAKLDSHSPSVLKNEVEGVSKASFGPLPNAYSSEIVRSRTESTFPIIRSIAIDENLGVEIKVEPT